MRAPRGRGYCESVGAARWSTASVAESMRAMAAWAQVAGPVPLPFALEHEREIRAAAEVHAELGIPRPAGGEPGEDVAAELPLQAISDLLGVPQEDRHKIFEWSNIMTSYDAGGDPDAPAIASMELIGYANAMAEDRAANPRDDIVTKLVQADVDGEHLSAEEFGWFDPDQWRTMTVWPPLDPLAEAEGSTCVDLGEVEESTVPA